MDHILQVVSSSKMMSMLDDFLAHNKVSVPSKDQHKIAFTTPWGNFAYDTMLFSLINVCTNFQMVMDLSFSDLKSKIIVIYFDDLTTFSKKMRDHVYHLECVLYQCIIHGISLNPKKNVFRITEGKLLGCIISKKGIFIYPK